MSKRAEHRLDRVGRSRRVGQEHDGRPTAVAEPHQRRRCGRIAHHAVVQDAPHVADDAVVGVGDGRKAGDHRHGSHAVMAIEAPAAGGQSGFRGTARRAPYRRPRESAMMPRPSSSKAHKHMPVRQLSETTVNRIAAGEVVERPASVVKELVENAVDAGARRIEIVTAGGGKTLIRVDRRRRAAWGRDDLALAVERHCTSKLSEDDLLDIRTLGFRGEALPSIGSVAELSIETRPPASRMAGRSPSRAAPRAKSAPAALARRDARRGARPLLRDARAPQVPEERARRGGGHRRGGEAARARPSGHPLQPSRAPTARRSTFRPRATRLDERIAQVMGREFVENAIPIDAVREGVRLTGLAGLGDVPEGERARRSTCSSTAARSATSCCSARCAPATPT